MPVYPDTIELIGRGDATDWPWGKGGVTLTGADKDRAIVRFAVADLMQDYTVPARSIVRIAGAAYTVQRPVTLRSSRVISGEQLFTDYGVAGQDLPTGFYILSLKRPSQSVLTPIDAGNPGGLRAANPDSGLDFLAACRGLTRSTYSFFDYDADRNAWIGEFSTVGTGTIAAQPPTRGATPYPIRLRGTPGGDGPDIDATAWRLSGAPIDNNRQSATLWPWYLNVLFPAHTDLLYLDRPLGAAPSDATDIQLLAGSGQTIWCELANQSVSENVVEINGAETLVNEVRASWIADLRSIPADREALQNASLRDPEGRLWDIIGTASLPGRKEVEITATRTALS